MNAAFDPEKLSANGEPFRMTERFIGSNHEPEYSPDGKSLAFLRKAPTGEARHSVSLIIRSLETGAERSVFKPERNYFRNRSIHWYPDSRSVLLEDTSGGNRPC